ncbi:retrovirus-related pol polyprotein from transposon TNT 1-94 [Tanacetum coccineum]
MANLSEDIQCAGSNTRPPMLDKTDFASWQQRTIQDTVAKGNEGALHLGPERPYVYSDLIQDKKDKYNADIRATNILLQGLPKYIYSLINHYTDAKDMWNNVKMLLEGSELTKEDRESQLYDDFEHSYQNKGETIHDYYVRFAKLINDMRNIKITMSKIQLNSKFVNNMLPEWGRFVTAVKLNKGLKDSNYDQLYAYLKKHEAHANNVQGRQNRGHGNNARGAGAAGYRETQNRVGNANPGQARQIKVVLDEEQLLFLAGEHDNVIDEDVDEQPVQDLALKVDNVFQDDDCDAYDSDVDEAPTAQSLFMPNLSSVDPVYDEAGPSHDSDILYEVQDHDHYQDAVCEHHEEHEMHDNDNAVPVVQNNVSKVPNDAYVMLDNDTHEPDVQSVSNTPRNTLAVNSLNAELATYKEQVELCKRRARFELTEREQKINEQLRIVISDRNIKEDNLKKELHSVKLQLASTIKHNKSMVDEVTSLKKDFKQKENKYLEEFLDLKALKDKVEDKLFKQGQSIQTVHMMCKPRSYYDEVNKVAIGYKNPLCLHHAKQVQPALYNGYVIVTPNHAPAIVHDGEDTLELTEISRKKMHDKMKANECVANKVNITPPDYSKENFLATFTPQIQLYLATFTPQKQLTPEQIFWSQDLIKMKAEALKTQATASRPIKALTVYPPNTPATLVPRVLPTKSQVKINIFALIQLFSDFEKTCNKRITPTGLTEGERGFEQTKACYLTEVIPFFKTLKEHFEGIQKALTKEIKEMKDIFEELEAEVDQNGVDRKHDEIERKNLLIANDNLIADCLSKEVFYVATNSELNVSSFTEMHDAHTSLKARCLELEVELSNLRDKIQKDNHDELIKRFSNLEVNHLNLQLKYQNLKESFGNNTSPPTRDVPDFDSVFVIEKMKASIQGKDNAIKKLRMEISQLNEICSEADRTLDFRSLDFQITQLTEKINVLQEQNELFRAENGKIKQHYKELYDSIKITRAKHLEQTTALLTENESLKVQIQNKLSCVNKDHVKPKVLAPRKYAIDVEPIPPRNRNNREVYLVYLKHLKESVETLCEIVEEAKVERPLDRSLASTCRVNSFTNASRSQSRSNTKKNMILSAKSVNMKKVEEHPRTIKTSLKTTNRVDSSISFKHNVVQIVLWYLDLGCSKHMTEDRSRLRNFMKKFIGTVRFGNDHFGPIMGYEEYVIGEKVAFRKHSCYVRDTDGVELIKGSRGSNLYTISIEDMMKSYLICLLSKSSKNKSWLWHRCLNHLNFDTINDLARKDLVRGLLRLKFEKDHLCSAFQLGKSKKHTHKPKTENTNLEVLNTLHMDLCRPMRVQTINGKKYILVIVDDYSRFTWVKFLRSKDETPEVVIKFLKQIQVGLNKTVRNIRTDIGTEFVNKDLTDYYKCVNIFHQKTVSRTPQQNGVVEGRNRTLVEAARTMLIFSKAMMLLWAEVVATTCYTQNRSLIHTRHYKTPYELVHDKKPDLTFFRVFSALFYLINDSQDLRKLQPTANIGIFVGYAPSMKGTHSTFLTPGQISSGLVPNSVPAAPYVPPTNKELEILFQPMFDEYMEPPRIERPVSPASAVQVPINSAGIPSSTTIDQDAPSPSHSSSSLALQSLSLHQGVAAESTLIEDTPFSPVVNNPFINVFDPEPSSEASSFGDLSSAESPYVSQTLHHLGK